MILFKKNIDLNNLVSVEKEYEIRRQLEVNNYANWIFNSLLSNASSEGELIFIGILYGEFKKEKYG